jgi:hypothetical protein
MGSKKSHSYLARLLRRTPRKEFAKIAVFQGINLTAAYFYSLSLEGGDVDYLISIVGYLGLMILGSLLLNIIVSLCNFYMCGGWVRVFNFIIQGIILFTTLTYDLGTEIMNHGQYNLLVLFLMILPIVLLFLLYKLCKYLKTVLRSWKW